jgi:hypothetical protein
MTGKLGKEGQVTTFLVLYNSPVPAAEMMAQVTPQQAQAGMDAWNAWAEKNGDSIVDLGVLEVLAMPGTER